MAIFLFDKRKVERTLVRPKKGKESISELLKGGVENLKIYQNLRLLQVIQGPEESPDSLAFVSEPLVGSLANILK